jgi:hypothetical protein
MSSDDATPDSNAPEPTVANAVEDVTRSIDAVRAKQGNSWAALAVATSADGKRSVAVIKPTDLEILEIAVEAGSGVFWKAIDFEGLEDAIALLVGADQKLRVTYRSPEGVRVVTLEVVPLG